MKNTQHNKIINAKKKHAKHKNVTVKRSNTKSSHIKHTHTHIKSLYTKHLINKFRKTKKLKNKTNNKQQNGGKVIASGSFGCLLKPPLQCSLKSDKQVDNTYVSKLMKKEEAKKEMIEINNIKKIIKDLDIDNYCLINDTFSCEPKILKDEDLLNFNENCDILSHYNTRRTNINNKLNELRIIQMKNGGIDLFDYFANLLNSIDNIDIDITDIIIKFNRLNSLLIEILNNVIKKLIINNYCHNDIKLENILINTNIEPFLIHGEIPEVIDFNPNLINPISIIDWGLGYTHDPTKIPTYFLKKLLDLIYHIL